MTVVRHSQSCVSGILRRAVRKCLVAMRLRVSVNKKQMLSVVSAGATAGAVGGVQPTVNTAPITMNNHHHHHHHHHRLRSHMASPPSTGTVGSSSSSSGGGKDPLSAGGTTTAGRHQYGGGYHAPVCLPASGAEVVNLPPSIALPDGEDHPYGGAGRVLHLRNFEQESEIYQKCTRPPPNRTVNDSESPPPYRCSSAGLLTSGSTTTYTSASTHPPHHHYADSTQQQQYPVIRCHSLTSSTSSSSKRPSLLSNNNSSSSSTSSTAELGTADFLQRTVKILTGTKQRAPVQGHSSGGTSVTVNSVVGVMVPMNPQRTRRDNNTSGSGSSSPTNRHSGPPV